MIKRFMPFEKKICCTIINCDPRWGVGYLCANDWIYFTPGSPSVLIISSYSELIGGASNNICRCLKSSIGIVWCKTLKWDPSIAIGVRCSRITNVSLKFIRRYRWCDTSSRKSQTSDTCPRSLQNIVISVWATNWYSWCIRLSLYYNSK